MPHPTRGPRERFEKTVQYLLPKRRILFLTTSNRWSGEAVEYALPKSTQLAHWLAERVGTDKVTILDIPSLKIYPCEGNVSSAAGNNCGVAKALLLDQKKNPSGHHRCWASLNNPDDELWRVSRELLASECVVFFASVRWGQTNMFYQKLIERLTWIENRHSTLREENIIKHIDAGLILVGQNWNGKKALDTQQQVLDYYGFRVRPELCWHWQYTQVAENEDALAYAQAAVTFADTFGPVENQS